MYYWPHIKCPENYKWHRILQKVSQGIVTTCRLKCHFMHLEVCDIFQHLHVKTRTLVPVHLWSTLIEKLILQRHVPRVSHLALQGRFMCLMVEFTSKVVIIFFSESSLRPLALSGQYDITLFCIKLSNLWALPAKMANEENPRHDLRSCISRDVSQRDANEYECFHNPLSNVNIHQHANTYMYSIRHASGCVHHISVWFEDIQVLVVRYSYG